MNEQDCTCGADRTGPSAEAHDDDCPAKWMDPSLGEGHFAPRSNKQALNWPWDKMRELSVKLKGFVVAEKIWQRGFDNNLRSICFPDGLEAALKEHGDIVTMWLKATYYLSPAFDPYMPGAELRARVEWCIAVVRCSYHAGFIFSEKHMEWLITRIKEDADALKPI